MQADAPSLDYPLTLRCHPATPTPVVRTIEAQATILADGRLRIAYRLWGDMVRLRIPTTLSSDRTDMLWEHTCFEAFIAAEGETAYREFNFSPSGQWAAYAFSDDRQHRRLTSITGRAEPEQESRDRGETEHQGLRCMQWLNYIFIFIRIRVHS